MNLVNGAPLSPSETVVLNPARFAAPDTVLSAGFAPLTGGAKVKASELADSLLAAALLANQEAGVLQLEIQKKKTLLIFTSSPLVAVPTGRAHAWPAGSLEAAIQRHVAEKGTTEAQDLLHAVLEEDSPDPVLHTIGMVVRGLHGRGLLARQETRHLKVFTSTSFVPTDELEPAIAASPPAPTEQLIAVAKARPDFWKALYKAVGAAVGLRKEYDPSSD